MKNKCLYVFFIAFSVFVRIDMVYAKNEEKLDTREALEAYLKASAKDTHGKSLLLYLEHWYGFDSHIKDIVLKISALAQEQNCAIIPDIYSFWLTQSYVDSLYPDIEEAWMETLLSYLEKRKLKDFNKYVKYSLLLLKDKFFYQSNIVSWRWQNGEIGYDKEEKAFVFTELDLKCEANSDSSVIYGISGIYKPLEESFYGNGGRVYWDRTGLTREQIYTDLSKSKIYFKTNKYTVDTALLYYNSLFDNPLIGKFTDKPVASISTAEKNYPKFTSIDMSVSPQDIFENIHIQGPYTQHGKKIVFGKDDFFARMTVNRGDTCLGQIIASQIVYNDNKLHSPLAAWTVYTENDSIYHNTAEVRYDNDKKVLSFGHSTLFGVNMPAMNTYHKLRLQFEKIDWNISENILDVGLLRIPGRSGIGIFTSVDAFQAAELDAIMVGAEYNPLYRLSKMAKSQKSDLLNIEDIANSWRVSETAVVSRLLQLASMGFLDYYPDEKQVVLLPKLYLYLQVSANKSDFDEIELVSAGEGLVKASLNLDSLNLWVFNVEEVLLSRKQNVFFRPDNGTLSVHRNRDMCFSGLLHAGTFDLYVRNACFSYDDFKINIGMIDTLLFSIKTEVDKYGEVKNSRVNTIIKSLSGVLYVDDKFNKSGRKDFPQYPIFESLIPSYVTYSDSTILGGIYKADSFYFKVNPFRMEQLNTFSPDSVRFSGTMFSAGIFPEFKESLRVMPDLSLGFSTETPDNGWSLYGGKAEYNGEIRLDGSGMNGKGKMTFLSSISTSLDWQFTPPKMSGTVESFVMSNYNNNFEYPEIRTDSAKMYFVAEAAEYHLSSMPKSFIYPYISPWRLMGEYTFSDTSAYARGKIEYGEEMTAFANNWQMRKNSFYADSVDFGIETAGGGRRFLFTKNASMNTDLLSQAAEIKTKDDTDNALFVSLPIHRYKTNAYALSWNWNEKTIEFNQNNIVEPNVLNDTTPLKDWFKKEADGLKLISLRPDQDSLQFKALKSKLSYKDSLLYSYGVRCLKVGDALLFPDSLSLVIGKDGRLQAFKNAQILFSENYPAFSFYGVDGLVLSANKYTASGWYNYSASGVGEVQAVFFDKIASGSDGYSEAKASIIADDKQEFLLDDGFVFSGKVRASALEAKWHKEDNLEFEGLVKLRYALWQNNENIDIEENMGKGRKNADKTEDFPEEEDAVGTGLEKGFKFKAFINPDSVKIPISEYTKDRRGRFVRAGFYSRSTTGYPHFVFMEPIHSSDQPIVSTTGYLSFSQEEPAYKISDSNGSEFLSLHLKTGDASAEDFLQLGLRTYELEPTFYGIMSKKEEPEGLYIQSVCKLDFFFSQSLFKSMADNLNKNTSLEGGEPASRPLLNRYIKGTLSTKESASLLKEIQNYGTLSKIPDKLGGGILFSLLNLVWDQETSSYRSVGKAELLSVGDQIINKKIKVMMSIRRTRRGDVIDLYIEASKYSWYYFHYADHILQVVSSDRGFNEILADLKSGKRKKGHFEFVVSTTQKKNIFVNSFERNESEDYDQNFENQD